MNRFMLNIILKGLSSLQNHLWFNSGKSYALDCIYFLYIIKLSFLFRYFTIPVAWGEWINEQKNFPAISSDNVLSSIYSICLKNTVNLLLIFVSLSFAFYFHIKLYRRNCFHYFHSPQNLHWVKWFTQQFLRKIKQAIKAFITYMSITCLAKRSRTGPNSRRWRILPEESS